MLFSKVEKVGVRTNVEGTAAYAIVEPPHRFGIYVRTVFPDDGYVRDDEMTVSS